MNAYVLFNLRATTTLALSFTLAGLALSQPLGESVESIDQMVMNAETVLVGRIVAIKHPYENHREALLTIRLEESLKGSNSDLFQVHAKTLYSNYVQALAHGSRVLVFAEGSSGSDASLILNMEYDAIELSRADFTIVRDAEQLLSYVRKVLSYGPAVSSMGLNPPDNRLGWDWRTAFQKQSRFYRLIVPIDKRLEREAHKWLDSDDWHKRYDAIGVLLYFKSTKNIEALKGLLDDPGYYAGRADSNKCIEWRNYMVRTRAYSLLKRWGVEVEEPVTDEFIPMYGEMENVTWGRIEEDGELEVLLQSPKLWRLQILVEKLSEADLKTLSQLKSLKELIILGSTLGDEDLHYLAQLPNLAFLSIIGASVTDAGVEELAKFPKLVVLNMRGTQVTQKGRADLMKMRPDLYILPD